MVKAVTLFLVVMMILALIGRLRVPRLPRSRRGPPVETARKCPRCGRYRIGRGACDCGERGDR